MNFLVKKLIYEFYFIKFKSSNKMIYNILISLFKKYQKIIQNRYGNKLHLYNQIK